MRRERGGRRRAAVRECAAAAAGSFRPSIESLRQKVNIPDRNLGHFPGYVFFLQLSPKQLMGKQSESRSRVLLSSLVTHGVTHREYLGRVVFQRASKATRTTLARRLARRRDWGLVLKEREVVVHLDRPERRGLRHRPHHALANAPLPGATTTTTTTPQHGGSRSMGQRQTFVQQ